MMENLGRGNWFLMFGLFVVGMSVFVAGIDWDSLSYSGVNYTTVEDSVYYHNLSLNISASLPLGTTFEIDPSGEKPIRWTNGSGVYNYSSLDVVSSWINVDSVTGNLTIDAVYDNQTGYFSLPLLVVNGSASKDVDVEFFEFIVNATNDAPNFTSGGIVGNYSFDPDSSLQNFILTASDEESHFPLIFDVSFNATNCTHGVGTGYSDNSDCDLSVFGLNVTHPSNTTGNIGFAPNSSYVGTYWANVSVMDAVEDYNCPHDWCDSTYNTTNLTTYYSEMVKFTISPSLDVDVSNCTGATLIEDEQFNCTVVITTPGETDSLTITSDVSFREGDVPGNYNSSWFNPDNSSPVASNFNHNVSFSVTPIKNDVGNLSVNFSVVDDSTGGSFSATINLYVNFTEFNVTMNAIGDVTFYEDGNISVVAIDEDLLILDTSVKDEDLNFVSNTSWVSSPDKITLSDTNYTTATFVVDYDSILAASGEGNYSVMINVTDIVGNTANRTFVVEVLNETAPSWNASLDDPVNLSLVEGTAFSYNVSVNVSDASAITFYYENVSGGFCSLNSSTFNSSSGIINFTPIDCDVGYHNVTIIASNGMMNSSHEFNFSVENIADAPTINDVYIDDNDDTTIGEGDNESLSEDSEYVFILILDDDDFMIPSGQRDDYYDESLTITVNATNSSGVEVALFNFSFKEIGMYDYRMIYNASFIPSVSQIDNFTVFVNISDVAGNFTNRTFYLNISETLDAPNLTAIDNLSVTIFDSVNFSVSATDNEDDHNELNLSFSIVRLNASAPNLTIGNETGRVEFNMNSNESYAGIWGYNVTVNDSDATTDIESFYVYVYGNATIVLPALGSVFNLTENVSGVLNFTISHSVGDNLTYEFWIDSISCSYQNSSNCDYGDFVLREIDSSFGNASIFGWSFVPGFTDESYGNYKNLTVKVYPNVTTLNSSQLSAVASNFSFKLNVSHTNQNVSFTDGVPIQNQGPVSVGSTVSIDLSNYFTDVDYLDSYVGQVVNFSLSTISGSGYVSAGSSFSDWVLTLNSVVAASDTLKVVAYEYDENNGLIGNVSSNEFNVTFIPPVVETVPTPSSGGSRTKLKYFSLKVVVPQDVIISDENYIDVPFSLQNTGGIDLSGIDLTSQILFNDEFSEDVKIELDNTFVSLLKIGETRDYSMRILVDTHSPGRYKATVNANVTSPRLSDWGDFFIELRKINETGAENVLIFTEKLLADNPECLELTELFNEAKDAFDSGDYTTALNLARDVGDACSDTIASNEQIRYPVVGLVRDNFYYISFSTLMVFVLGFVFYVYKRVRFNKYRVDEL